MASNISTTTTSSSTNQQQLQQQQLPPTIMTTPAPTQTNTTASSTSQQQPQQPVENLILLVHGIGKHEEKWQDKITKINVMFQNVCNSAGLTTRNTKFVGVEWHSALHSKTDTLIGKVTPPSIPVVHSLVNHTILDILFWASPTYSQTIYSEVGEQLNEKYREFIKANPNFKGKVHILAHSLGSVIAFDILCHQKRNSESLDIIDNINRLGNVLYWRKTKQPNGANQSTEELDDASSDISSPGDSLLPHLTFPQLDFDVHNLFSIGSPLGVLYTIRGHTQLSIPKCINFFNIIDQSDPVAYLVEPLIDDGFCKLPPVVLPHLIAKKSTISIPTNLQSKFSSFKVKALNIIGKTPPASPSPATSPSFGATVPSINSTAPLPMLEDSFVPDSPARKSSSGSSTTTTTTTANTTTTTTASTKSNNNSPTNTTEDTSDDDPDVQIFYELEDSNKVVINVAMPTSTTSSTSTSTTPPITTTTTTTTEEQPNTNSQSNNLFFGGNRYDYKIKPGLFNISEYQDVPFAHKGYWSNKDVIFFIAQRLEQFK
ncbi:DDHD domain-containing protein [Heterostelium album PN500]|uniref:DDHD domain-containing protein n=1 Tax=Heterostelium pallidum (strain ATCC 26659 / Pp 5 / PN500) TaxID=670386 RepID=D3B836_HETP5|nr:DDHD domain-containing protein [Heterostelium album PN500]EFA82204.1 DDHD domain-containing protein [Heterostelium album PN500]|eukprot:XP_020434321.1 DDHD domain-containing protein [Heterostelium album PN500]